jgi:alkanesulfonate monooxygenase SsuD/methylene tetrahydromethanopterin reductase-like flavin-dependent oxidoreductase (luciferase family)
MLKDVWIGIDGDRARDWFLPRLSRHYQEEAGAWWVLKGDGHGFSRPTELERQVERAVRSAVVGSPDEVAERIAALAVDGVDHVVARLNFDFVPPRALDAAMELFADTVLKAVAP